MRRPKITVPRFSLSLPLLLGLLLSVGTIQASLDSRQRDTSAVREDAGGGDAAGEDSEPAKGGAPSGSSDDATLPERCPVMAPEKSATGRSEPGTSGAGGRGEDILPAARAPPRPTAHVRVPSTPDGGPFPGPASEVTSHPPRAPPARRGLS